MAQPPGPPPRAQPLSSEPVYFVAIGVNRSVALSTGPLFSASNAAHPNSRPYRCAAVLDFVETAEPYRFSGHNLGAVLHNLHPRPQALITGTAVSEDVVKELEPVWGAYVRDVIKKEAAESEDSWSKTDGKTCWVQMHKTHGAPGPPPPGALEECLRQLDEAFRT